MCRCGSIIYELVKLQRRFAYKYKDKNHYKHILTVPNEYISKLGWKDGTDVELKVHKDELVLKSTQKDE
jgi:hypothetical protein